MEQNFEFNLVVVKLSNSECSVKAYANDFCMEFTPLSLWNFESFHCWLFLLGSVIGNYTASRGNQRFFHNWAQEFQHHRQPGCQNLIRFLQHALETGQFSPLFDYARKLFTVCDYIEKNEMIEGERLVRVTMIDFLAGVREMLNREQQRL